MKQKKMLMNILIALFIMPVIYAQGPGQYVTGQQGPTGGTGGSFYNTTQLGNNLLSVTIRSGAFIDGIRLNFDSKADPSDINCGGQGGSPKTLTLIQGEYIVRVMGKYNRFVEYLYIQTDGTRKQYMEFGNTNTTAPGYFDYQAVEGMKIGNFVVRGGQYIDAIGIILMKR